MLLLPARFHGQGTVVALISGCQHPPFGIGQVRGPSIRLRRRQGMNRTGLLRPSSFRWFRAERTMV
jgi:hypothetical protein